MDQPSRIPWPPLIYVGAIIVSFVLGRYYPLPWLPKIIADGLLAVGVLLVVGGFAFVIYAIRTLVKHKTTVSPTKKTNQLVTSGPFALSRNPIYLGNTILTVGFGVLFSNPWFFIGALIAAIVTNYLQIVPEEKHLAHFFGKQWRNYAKKVRRWF